MSYSPWGYRESDMTEWLTHTYSLSHLFILLSLIAILGSEHCYCYFQGGDTEPQRGCEYVPRSHNRKLIYPGTEHGPFYCQRHFCSKCSDKKTPLPTKGKIDRRKKHTKKVKELSWKWRAMLYFVETMSSLVLLKNADPRGNEREKKQPSDTFPVPSSLNPCTQGAALPFPRVAQCCGSTEENNYWFSYLESATLFGCVRKWQSTWALHLLPSLKLKGRE